MTFEVCNSKYPSADFGPDAYVRFGEAWRWRMAGFAIMAASTALSTTLYWKLGIFIVS